MHIYEKDGKSYPSVTTVLQLISTNEDLLQWANFMGFKRKDIKVIKNEAAQFGTYLHERMQKHVDPAHANDPICSTNAIYDYRVLVAMEYFDKTFADIPYRTITTEKTIISERLGFAGTLDWLTYIYDDVVMLGDFKTSKHPKVTMFLQLGGYYKLLLEEGYDPDVASIIICNDERCKLYSIDREQLDYYGEAFIKLFEFYQVWEQKKKPTYISLPKIHTKEKF